jgi:Domain of unknown function (DUF4375)
MISLREEFERACSIPHEGSAFDALPERDRILVAIWGLEADVNNGGFDQYYFNSSGDRAFFAAEALERIGASQMAAIVREANALFGPEGPSRDRDHRVRRLFEITADDEDLFDALDRRFFEYPDDISALLIAYIENEMNPVDA